MAGWLVYMSNGAMRLYVAGVSYEFNMSLSLNVWCHIAFVRSGTTLHLYKDGVEVGTGVDCSANITAANPLWIGNDYGRDVPYQGYIDELLISNNARYSANFTPATAAYAPTGSAYTVKTFQFT
jgi:hypothetical protein